MTTDEIIAAAAALQDQNIAPVIVALAQALADLQQESAYIHRLMRCLTFALPPGYTAALSDDDIAQFQTDYDVLQQAIAMNTDPAAAITAIVSAQPVSVVPSPTPVPPTPEPLVPPTPEPLVQP